MSDASVLVTCFAGFWFRFTNSSSDFGRERTVRCEKRISWNSLRLWSHQIRHKNAYHAHLKLSLAKLSAAIYCHSCASQWLTMAPDTAPQTCLHLLHRQIVFSATGPDKMTQTTDVKASRAETSSLVRSSSVGLAFKPTQMSCTSGLIAPGLLWTWPKCEDLWQHP